MPIDLEARQRHAADVPTDRTQEPARRPRITASGEGTWRRWVPAVAGAVALGAHLVVGVAYASTGLLAPGWAVALLAVWWVALGVLLLVLALRGRPLLTLLVPVVALTSWIVVIFAGGTWLGWTA